MHEDTLRREFEYGILHKYPLLPWVYKNKRALQVIAQYVDEVYEQIVAPMTNAIKHLMKDFVILNESELLSAEMKFLRSDKDIQDKFIGDMNDKYDVIENRNQALEELKRKFQSVMYDIVNRYYASDVKAKDLTKKKDQMKVRIAYTIYFATYFHPENRDCVNVLKESEALGQETN